jgi:hypothetical protein
MYENFQSYYFSRLSPRSAINIQSQLEESLVNTIAYARTLRKKRRSGKYSPKVLLAASAVF